MCSVIAVLRAIRILRKCRQDACSTCKTDLDFVHEFLGHEVLVLSHIPPVHTDGQVLGHVPRLHCLNDSLLHVLREHLMGFTTPRHPWNTTEVATFTIIVLGGNKRLSVQHVPLFQGCFLLSGGGGGVSDARTFNDHRSGDVKLSEWKRQKSLAVRLVLFGVSCAEMWTYENTWCWFEKLTHPERLVVVELSAVEQPTRPREDWGDRVGGRLLTLLVLAPVPCYRAVRSLRLQCWKQKKKDTTT